MAAGGIQRMKMIDENIPTAVKKLQEVILEAEIKLMINENKWLMFMGL